MLKRRNQHPGNEGRFDGRQWTVAQPRRQISSDVLYGGVRTTLRFTNCHDSKDVRMIEARKRCLPTANIGWRTASVVHLESNQLTGVGSPGEVDDCPVSP